jgi:Xaa-Pro aminopeptidase
MAALGSVTDKQRELFNVMREAQIATFESVKAGIRACDVDEAGRNVIKKMALESSLTTV